MHGPLIRKESYMDGDFSIPATVEEVAALLPGNTQYDDVEELLVTIGKQPDRALLHSFVSKLLKVPPLAPQAALPSIGLLMPSVPVGVR